MESSREDFAHALHEWNSSLMDLSMHRMAAFARDRGLSMSQIGALFRLHHSGACAVTDIAENIGVSPAAASQLLDRLVQADLLIRTEDPEDRRVRRIELSDHGREIIREMVGTREGIATELAGRFPDDELDAASRVLTRLAAEARLIKQEKPE
jgi:DNA-binding MarR family transcriptional regulator